MNIITQPDLRQHLHGAGEREEESSVQGTHSLIDWIILACTESWPNEGDLPGHVAP